jgi:NitT/TauT family transport system permease protein/taurine transport system permease protein
MSLTLERGIAAERAARPAAAGQSWREEVVDLHSERNIRRRAARRRLAIGASGLAGVLLTWQIAAVLLGDAVILPSVTQTGRSLGHYFTHNYPSQSPPLWQDLLISLRRIALGFVGGTLIGVGVAAAMFSSRVVRHLVDPIVEVLRPLPPLAFIPLFIVWFGIGELPKEVLIGFGVVPVMIVATLAALDDVPDDLRLAARTLGATPGYALTHVQIRAALPSIITGMRIALGGAWTSIVAAEMLAATSGVGFVIGQAGNYLDTALVFACIVLIGATELALDTALRLVARRIDPAGAGRNRP